MATKAFHESIVDSINECNNKKAFEVLCKLVHETKIPKNHQEISNTITASPYFSTLANADRVLAKLTEEAKPSSSNTVDEEETDDYHKNHFVTGVSDNRG